MKEIGGIENQSFEPVRVNHLLRCLADIRRAAHLQLTEGIVAPIYSVSPADLYLPGRGARHLTECRQVIMYLAHVVFGLSQRAAAGRYHRHRSTASLACRKIEDMRDDPDFDDLVSGIEAQISQLGDPQFAGFRGRL